MRDLHGTVADHEHGVGRALQHRDAHRQFLDPGGPDSCWTSSQIRASTWLVRDPASSASRSTCSHGTRVNSLTLRTGPLSRDREPGDDLIAPVHAPQILDRRDQGHVQRSLGQLLGQPAGHVHRQDDLGGIVAKLIIERLCIEIAHRSYPDRSVHCDRASSGPSGIRSSVRVELSESFEILGAGPGNRKTGSRGPTARVRPPRG